MTMIDSGTVDLVTVATGLHWLNIEKFLQEVKRILKPGGTFAAYSWYMGRLEPEAANILHKELLLKMKDFMTSKARIRLDKYQSIKFPFQDLRRFEIEAVVETDIDKIKGHVSSIHIVPLYNDANPGNDELDTFGKSLEAIINHDGDSGQPVRFKEHNSVFMVMGRNR